MGGSSSRRRRPPRRRFSPRPRPASASHTTELSFQSLAITNGIGYDLLRKSGWHPGSPLGQSPVDHDSPLHLCSTASSSPTTPLNVVVKRGRAGLGMRTKVVVEDGAGREEPGLPIAAPARPPRGRGRWDATVDVFDPLRPRCQYDPTHVVSSLKRLRKHEMRCPANPARGGAGGGARGGEVTVRNLFGGLSLQDLTDDDDDEEDEEEDDDEMMSQISGGSDDTSDVSSAMDSDTDSDSITAARRF